MTEKRGLGDREAAGGGSRSTQLWIFKGQALHCREAATPASWGALALGGEGASVSGEAG